MHSTKATKKFPVFEFGVAGGNGLFALENLARAVTAEIGIKIAVYGFDAGTGMPELTYWKLQEDSAFTP